MKRILIIIVKLTLFSILLISCKKKNEETSKVILPDDIVYTDISPDTSFTSISGWFDTGGFGVLPIPDDSTAGMALDFDQDGLPDLQFTISTEYKFVSASNPWANYNFHSEIIALDTNDSVASVGRYSVNHYIAKSFTKDSLIAGNSAFSTKGFMYGAGISTINLPAPTEETYYGLKIAKNGGFIYGWILININPASVNKASNILTLKEYAMNLTLNNPIKAGQKK